MNMKLNLKFDPQALLKVLGPLAPYIVGLAVVGVFGYTGWVINQAFHVEPNAAAPAASPAVKVTFDKQTVEMVKNLHVVPGQVQPTDVGKNDPFGN